MLSKLALRAAEEQLPFDMVRCSFDGLLHFTLHGFGEGFFPASLERRPFIPDPASIWLLFRAQHTCMTHFNLNSDRVIQHFLRCFDEWEKMLTQPTRPVTFLRTCIAENAREEVELLPLWHEVLRKKSLGRLDFRTVMVIHDQGPTTERVAMFAEKDAAGAPCVVWNLAFNPNIPPEASLFDKCHDGYAHIIREMSIEEAWRRSTTPLCLSAPRPYTNLCRVEGVPALRGSCTGFGTTHAALLGHCLRCGSSDGHPVEPEAFDTKRSWTNTEDAVVLEKLMVSNGDEVAAVEASALKLNRGANEVLQRLRLLTACV